jgi:catechol 2,3-dioxygenase-like lactoylglutathione lyase family enzyme
MLGKIRAVTTTAPDLKAIEAAYTEYLGYRVVARGRITEATAKGWGAPAVAGAGFLVMMPASGAEVYLRFVEQAPVPGFRPATSFGWNATEILVQDVEALAKRLRDSPFKIVGEPHPLDNLPDIHAMQVTGPAGELLYLTWKKPVTPDIPLARSFVDYCFIAVLGGPDMEAMRGFYRSTFGNDSTPPRAFHINVITDAGNLPPDTTYPLSLVPLQADSKLELDQYPPSARPRARPAGLLPPGMSIVTFEHGKLGAPFPTAVGPITPASVPPFPDHRTLTVTGAAGELIELVEV